MATDSSAPEIRHRLAALGAQREAREEEDTALRAEIVAALREAKGIVSKAEAARLLRMERSTLYRVYAP